MADASGRNMRKRKAPSEDPNPRPTVAPRTTVSEKPTVTKPPKAPVAPKAAPPASYDPAAAESTEATTAKAEGGVVKLKLNVSKKKAPPRKKTPPPPAGQLFFHPTNRHLSDEQKQAMASLNKSQPSAVQGAPLIAPADASTAQPSAAPAGPSPTDDAPVPPQAKLVPTQAPALPGQIMPRFNYMERSISKEAVPLHIDGRYIHEGDGSKTYYYHIRWQDGSEDWLWSKHACLTTPAARGRKVKKMISDFDAVYAKTRKNASSNKVEPFDWRHGCVRPPLGTQPHRFRLQSKTESFKYFGHSGLKDTPEEADSTVNVDGAIIEFGATVQSSDVPADAAKPTASKASSKGWVEVEEGKETKTLEDMFKEVASDNAGLGQRTRRKPKTAMPLAAASVTNPASAVPKSKSGQAPPPSTTDSIPAIANTPKVNKKLASKAPKVAKPALQTALKTIPEGVESEVAPLTNKPEGAVTGHDDALEKEGEASREQELAATHDREITPAPAPPKLSELHPPQDDSGIAEAVSAKDPAAQEKQSGHDARAARRTKRAATPAATDAAPGPAKKVKLTVSRKNSAVKSRAGATDAATPFGATISSASISHINEPAEQNHDLLKKSAYKIILRCERRRLPTPGGVSSSQAEIETLNVVPSHMIFEEGGKEFVWVNDSLKSCSRVAVFDKGWEPDPAFDVELDPVHWEATPEERERLGAGGWTWSSETATQSAGVKRAEELLHETEAKGKLEQLYLIGWAKTGVDGVRRDYRQFVAAYELLEYVSEHERQEFEDSLPSHQQHHYTERKKVLEHAKDHRAGQQLMDIAQSRRSVLVALGLNYAFSVTEDGDVIRLEHHFKKNPPIAIENDQLEWWWTKQQEKLKAQLIVDTINAEVKRANQHVLNGGNLPAGKRTDPATGLQLINYSMIRKGKLGEEEEMVWEDYTQVCHIKRWVKPERPNFMRVEVRDVPDSLPPVQLQAQVQLIGPQFRMKPVDVHKVHAAPGSQPSQGLSVWTWAQKMMADEVLTEQHATQTIELRLRRPKLIDTSQAQKDAAKPTKKKKRTLGGFAMDDGDDGYLSDSIDEDQLRRQEERREKQGRKESTKDRPQARKPQALDSAKSMTQSQPVTAGPSHGSSELRATAPTVDVRRYIDHQKPGCMHVQVRGAPKALHPMHLQVQVQAQGPKSGAAQTPTAPVRLQQQAVNGTPKTSGVDYAWTQNMGADFELGASHAHESVQLARPIFGLNTDAEDANLDDEGLEEELDEGTQEKTDNPVEDPQEEVARRDDGITEQDSIGAGVAVQATGASPALAKPQNAAEGPVVTIHRWIDPQSPGRIHIEVRDAPSAWRSSEVQNQVQAWGPRSTGEKTPSKPMLLEQQIVHGRPVPAYVIYEWTQDMGYGFVLSAHYAQQTVTLKPNAGAASFGGMVPNARARSKAAMEQEVDNGGEVSMPLGAASKIAPLADKGNAEQDLDRADKSASKPTLTSTDLGHSPGVKRGREEDDGEGDDVVVPSKRLRHVPHDSPMDSASEDEAGFEAPNRGMSGSDGLAVPGSMGQEADDVAESVPLVNGLSQILLPPQDSRSSPHNKRRGLVEESEEEEAGFVERAGKRQRLNKPREKKP